MTKKIWIDIDNSPHVLFFNPISAELIQRGYNLILTARDAYQVKELLHVYKMNARVIGRHYGKNKILKILGCLYRALQLAPLILKERPDVAVCHGSRSMLFLSKILNIPLIIIFDYEYGQTVPFIKPDLLIVPEIVTYVPFYPTDVLKYKGIKEDVYVPFFQPDDNLQAELNLTDHSIIVTIRPPATEAHYHNDASETLFEQIIDYLSEKKDVQMIVLPRNKRQADEIKKKWHKVYKDGKMIIPAHALDGLSLLWNSDLVISGGGTMNREATALGVPVYSIFRGKMGAVDLFLEKEKKMTFIENTNDIGKKIVLQKRARTKLSYHSHKVLERIVGFITSFLENPVEIQNNLSHDVQFKNRPSCK